MFFRFIQIFVLWVDIFVLQRVLIGKVPFIKFFLKKELIWVPFFGLAWCGITFAANVRERSTILQWDAVEALRAMMHSNITPPLRSRMQMARGRRDTGWFARDDKAKLSQILSFVK